MIIIVLGQNVMPHAGASEEVTHPRIPPTRAMLNLISLNYTTFFLIFDIGCYMLPGSPANLGFGIHTKLTLSYYTVHQAMWIF